jgi:glycosyltransferase involved in cell wall biosynthesis
VRILVVCPSYPPRPVTCGVGDYTRCLAEALARQGEAVAVACATERRGDGEIPVTALFRRFTPGAALRLAAAPALTGADVVHVQYAPELYGRAGALALPGLLARLRLGRVATVVTFHTLTDGSLASRLAATLLLAGASHAISANEEVTGMVRRRLPAFGRRLTEIPIGTNVPVLAADPAARHAARERLHILPGAPLLVHFGLVYPGKGLETLFAAMAALAEVEPKARLVVVGDTRPADAGYRAGLDALRARLRLGEAVIWAGRQPGDEVSRLLQAADLFVAPYDDGASLRRGSLVAGLAHGLPVVSTRPAVASAYLRDGENVALVPPRDPAALAASLRDLLARPEAAARLGRAARRLGEQLDWATIARATRDVYRRVAAP